MYLTDSGLLIRLPEAITLAGLLLLVGHLLGMATYHYFERKYGPGTRPAKKEIGRSHV